MIVALDSSAMIAWLNDEPEAPIVDAVLAQIEEEGAQVFAHSVNLAEVYYHVVQDEDEPAAEEAISLLLDTGIIERPDIDGDFWRDIARTIAAARRLPKPSGGRENLALGDAFGVALANRLGGDFLTKDRNEIEPLERAGLVSAQFIR
jgi:uncharacterized protein with PIN domain